MKIRPEVLSNILENRRYVSLLAAQGQAAKAQLDLLITSALADHGQSPDDCVICVACGEILPKNSKGEAAPCPCRG